MIKRCKHCGGEFESGKGNRRHCSQPCQKTVRKDQQRNEYIGNWESHQESHKTYIQNHPKEHYLNTVKNRDRYPERRAARALVERLKIQGIIIYPETCSICFSKGKVHAHHPDYSMPNKIQFLCPDCHRNVHQARRANGST